jgi:hypothetical protein
MFVGTVATAFGGSVQVMLAAWVAAVMFAAGATAESVVSESEESSRDREDE